MKRKLYLLMAAAVAVGACAGSAACTYTEEDVTYLMQDGVYECDHFDGSYSRFYIDAGAEDVEIATDYPRGKEAGSFTSEAWNYAEENVIQPRSDAAEDAGYYVWKPMGASLGEWLDKLYASQTIEEAESYSVTDYVAVVYYEQGYPVTYAVWKCALRPSAYETYWDELSIHDMEYIFPVAMSDSPK